MASYQDMLRQVFRASSFPVEEYAPAHWNLTPEMIGELRMLPYFDQWRRALDEKWFHVKLEDHSIFVFNETTGNRSYQYLHCPLDVETYRNYLKRKGFDYTIRNRNAYSDEYDFIFETAQIKKHVTPIRYDVDPIAYRSGRHPLAHIHIGLDNNIRLGVRREMTPLGFTLFVMRQMYPESWEKLLAYAKQFKLNRVLRADLTLIPDAYWKENDDLELHLA